jgi:Ser/Thr protein kinase RdoA (MazF antagonist)
MIDAVAGVVGPIVGLPVAFDDLKHRPGRRRTLRARGPRASVIVKLYASERAAVVARRVAALGSGPPEPIVPRVLHVDSERHVLVLSDVPGRPLREDVLQERLESCNRVGTALGAWHSAWLGAAPRELVEHTVERELELLRTRMATTTPAVAALVRPMLAGLSAPWVARTVVHRDLYEEQVMVGDKVGLIDVDDAAVGPPELDLGNLVAHLELLARRRGVDLAPQATAIFEGYAGSGPSLDHELLQRCRALTLVRLACLNDDPELVRAAAADGLAARS